MVCTTFISGISFEETFYRDRLPIHWPNWFHLVDLLWCGKPKCLLLVNPLYPSIYISHHIRITSDYIWLSRLFLWWYDIAHAYNMHTCSQTRIHIYAHTHIYIYIYIVIDTHIYPYVYICIYIYIYTHMNVYLCASHTPVVSPYILCHHSIRL